MTDREIKQALKDASLYLSDAAKRWPKHKDTARVNLRGAIAVIDQIHDYVYRPMGDEEEDADRILGSMVNGF